jgi:quercetin dioxygenase-like cupin family protein
MGHEHGKGARRNERPGNIPYEHDAFGKRKVVDEENLLMMQVALKPGQATPRHAAWGDLHILVIKGQVKVSHGDRETAAPEGTVLRLANGTPMSVSNESGDNASFLVMKAPNPGPPPA